MNDKVLTYVLKNFLSKKYNITVTDIFKHKKENDKYWYVRYDYWNDLKFKKNTITYVYYKDILTEIRKMKLKKLGKQI